MTTRTHRLVVTLAALATAGCGVLSQGTHQPIFVDSVPSGHRIEIDGVPYTTPVTVELTRKPSHVVTARNSHGATARRVLISESSASWHLADMFLGPLFVWNIVDAATGGDSSLHPESLIVPIPADDAATDRWW